MSEYIYTDIDGMEARVKRPAAGEPALITDYGTLDDYIELHKKHYEEKRADFFDTLPTDPNLPKKAKRWESVARTWQRLALTLIRIYGEDNQYYNMALEM